MWYYHIMSLAFFGEALYDCYSDAPPTDPIEPLLLRANPGGGVFNAAIGAKRYLRQHADSPLPVAFIGGISTDAFGRRMLDLLRVEEVDTKYCYDSQRPTALAMVLNDPDGERSFGFHRHRTADLDYPQKLWDAEWFREMGLFACDTNCMTTEDIFTSNMAALEYARAASVMTAIDVNIRPALWSDEQDLRSRIRRALCYATLIKFSAEELSLVFSGNDERHHVEQLFMLSNRANVPRVLCVSRGGEGCSVYFENRNIDNPAHIAAPQVDAVDTTGAGDAFFGALCAYIAVHPLAHDSSDHELLQRGAHEAVMFAAHTVQYQGALRYPLPPRSS